VSPPHRDAQFYVEGVNTQDLPLQVTCFALSDVWRKTRFKFKLKWVKVSEQANHCAVVLPPQSRPLHTRMHTFCSFKLLCVDYFKILSHSERQEGKVRLG